MGNRRRRRLWFLVIASVVIAALLGITLLLPYAIPAQRDTVPPEALADPDSRFIELNGVRVHYKIYGQGEPTFVLLHGLGSSTFSWHKVADMLAAEGTVIAFDRPGFGLTSRPLPGDWQGENPYSREAQAKLTVALLDALGRERAVLVGHSAGGSLAFLTALRYPERVTAVVLVDAAIYTEGGAPPWILPLLRTPPLRRLGPLFVRLIFGANGDRLLQSAWYDPSKITPELIAGYRKATRVTNWDRAFWEFTLASEQLSLATQVATMTLPALVITGGNDTWVPTAESIRLADELPNAQLAVIPDCGHVPQEECPAAFLTAIVPFLRGIPPPQPR